MKILVISNIYPPYFVGGYELACRKMVLALEELGHDVRVLTSTYGVGKETVDGRVHRLLQINFDRLPSLIKVLLKEITNQQHFRKLCMEFEPDVVFCWNMSNISLSLVCIANDLNIPVSYYVFDNWLATCEMDQWFQHSISLAPLCKFLLHYSQHSLRIMDATEPNGLNLAIFASNYLKNVACLTGKDTTESEVLHWGVSPETSVASPEAKLQNSILYVGQIVPLKGVHTLVEAIGLLYRDFGLASVNLTIVGDDKFNPVYVSHLRGLISSYGITNCVRFVGKISSDKIGEFLETHRIFVFSSVWDEPFGISQLEAMASGLVVVGTATGGSAEILKHDVNGVVFERENPQDCARQIHRLIEDSDLYMRLRVAGMASVQNDFNFETAVCKMERILKEIAVMHTHSATKLLPVRDVFLVVKPSDADIFPQKLFSVLLLVTFVCFKRAISWLRGLVKKNYDAVKQNFRSDMILFVALGNSSDLVLASIFIQHYHDTFPDRKIGIVLRSHLAHLVKDLPIIEYVISFPFTELVDWQKMTRGHFRWWHEAGKIFDTCLNPIQSVISLGWRSDSVAAASATFMHRSGVRKIIGFRDPGTGYKRRILNFLIEDGPVRKESWNGMEAMKSLFSTLGVQGGCGRFFSDGPIPKVDLQIELNSIFDKASGPLIAIAPGGDSDLCCWPLKHYIELGNWLQSEHDATLLILGEKSDYKRCYEFLERLSGEKKYLLDEILGLEKIVNFMSSISLLCGNDNRFFYSAVLADRPTVGLFGPSINDNIDLIPGRQEIIRLAIPCSPCSDICLYNKAVCMDGINTARVMKAINAKL